MSDIPFTTDAISFTPSDTFWVFSLIPKAVWKLPADAALAVSRPAPLPRTV